jgi:hypothetical protein
MVDESAGRRGWRGWRRGWRWIEQLRELERHGYGGFEEMDEKWVWHSI